MFIKNGFSPTRQDHLTDAKLCPVTLTQLLQATHDLKCQPIITLATAIEQLGLLNPWEFEALMREDPQLLRSKSAELVRRLLMTPEELHHALARTAGMVEVDAAHFELPDPVFEVQLLRKMRTHDLLFLGTTHETVFVASWCPTDESMHSRLREMTGRSVQMVWGERDAIAMRLDRLDPLAPLQAPEHGRLKSPQALLRKASAGPVAVTVTDAARPDPVATDADADADAAPDQDMAHLMVEVVRAMASGPRPDDSEDSEDSDAPASPNAPDDCGDAPDMADRVKRLIMDAQALEASDIHIETNPGEEFTCIRLRRDGHLELYQKLPAKLRAAMVARIKVMAQLDISERRRPQDGRIELSDFGGASLALRVSIMPTHDGVEDVVMRLLASSQALPLARLGLQPRDAQAVARMYARPFGLILVAGPAGSGKTTTLHAMLAEITADAKKIWTAEDPVEIIQPGLRQVQINPAIGLTFASALRVFLRADPDVIMVGEIGDQETAKMLIDASLTGHLMLSTLQTSSASEGVARLLALGLEAMDFADALVGIVAQRLVRSLCPHCALSSPLAPGQFRQLVKEYVYGSPLSEVDGARRLLTAAGVALPDAVRIKTAQGCEHCGNKGYQGQIGIYEILENTPAMRQLIQRHGRPAEIYKEAFHAGMHSLRHDALEKAFMGLIDLRQARLAYV